MEENLFEYTLNQSTISTCILLQIDPFSLSKSILVCRTFYKTVKSKDFWKLKFNRSLIKFNFTRMMKYYFFVYYKDDYWSQKYKVGKRKFMYGQDWCDWWCDCIELKNKKIRKNDKGKKTYYRELSSKIDFELVDPGELKLDCNHRMRRISNFGEYQLNENSISFCKTGSNHRIEMKVILEVNERKLLCIDKRGKIYENTWKWDGTMENCEIVEIEFAIDIIYLSFSYEYERLYVLYPWGQVIRYDYKYNYNYYHPKYHTSILIIDSETLDFKCKKFYGNFMLATDDRKIFIKCYREMVPIEIKYIFENIKCISSNRCNLGRRGDIREFYLLDGVSLYLLTVDVTDTKTATIKKIKNMSDVVSLHDFPQSLIITKD